LLVKSGADDAETIAPKEVSDLRIEVARPLEAFQQRASFFFGVSMRLDVYCIDRTIELTHEAPLAIFAVYDARLGILHAYHVGGTGIDAGAAPRTHSLVDSDFDTHWR
jgi:hypothetical protein